MGREARVTDAEFEVVDGPYRVGDEHRHRRGWYLTDRFGRHGEPLWYKPPGPISRAIKYAGLIVYLTLITVGIAGVLISEGWPHITAWFRGAFG